MPLPAGWQRYKAFGRFAYGFSSVRAKHLQLFDDRAKRQGRQEGQGADHDHGADQQKHEQRGMGRQGAGAGPECSSWRPASRRWPAPGR
jgi:hypothetical protein